MKYLVINADDFGFTRDVNEGIVEAHRNGILTATTLMANGAAFEDAVRLAREIPTLDIGCHLALIGGNSLLDPARRLPSSTAQLTAQVYAGKIAIYDELEAQVRKIVAAGVEPTHLDTHKHTHLLPPVLRAVCAIAENFGIQWIRRPIDFGAASTGELKQRTLGRIMSRVQMSPTFEAHGIRHTDHFWGFAITGKLNEAALAAVMAHIPDGSTELMTHPGKLTAELAASPTRLKASRAAELQALVSPVVRNAVSMAGIQLVNYRQLNRIALGEGH